ncbi:efflux RND transporter periplasmic adaptor subunit [Bradyrhizobium neotropicale]|uniref:efflux RND transporter periplasmic adaptor subunit n=1 Tax=Bradyrhizobium neotropicale TaxID=1497615 RepID=UPI001AD6DD43|nr:efflux RND transporter periplasmic adaptor subunit [Bradyrhizobium neotropicale]MBO4225247.1 efflux RND transporter periplasmic adaptor subunit [Bradyrhizobium neotropicale]
MYSSRPLPRVRTYLAAAAFLALTIGGVAAQHGAELPPPAVSVIELKAHPVPVVNELPGRIAATRISEVRARVSGILQARVFTQGTPVKEGDVLYLIDPKLFQVRVASAEASLRRAKAVQQNARQQFERQKTLHERDATSGVNLDTATATLAQADADVALAEAALAEAKINLDYTEVRAPISGIIGGALVTEGALVTADGTQNLALIQQVDSVYVDFTQSAQDLLTLKRAVEEGKLASPAPGEARVELVFDDGGLYAEAGRLLFASASVDSTTGQVTLRAEFPNPKHDLLPGMYVRVRIAQAVREGAITIPQRAVTRARDGRAQVYLVSEGGIAETRDVELGQALGSEWIVESGLKEGERVVVDGVQKVRVGGKVVPEPWKPADREAGISADQPNTRSR